MGDLFGVNAIVLVLAAVDAAQVEGVGEDEGEVGLLAGIGEPIPAEHAFAADGQIVAIRLDELEEVVEVVVLDVGMDQLLAPRIHDADVHAACMKIDSAVEFCGGLIEFHGVDTIDWRRETPIDVCYAGSVGSTPRPSPRMIAQTNKGFDGSIKALHTNRLMPLQFVTQPNL